MLLWRLDPTLAGCSQCDACEGLYHVTGSGTPRLSAHVAGHVSQLFFFALNKSMIYLPWKFLPR
jgi:hypothetical protein